MKSLPLMEIVALLLAFPGEGSPTVSPTWKWRRDGFPFGHRLRIEGENETL